jgi:hypothetical protein
MAKQRHTSVQPLLMQTPSPRFTHYYSRSCAPHCIACPMPFLQIFMQSILPLSAKTSSTTGSTRPALGEEATALFVRVLVVNALRGFAGIGGVGDGAVIPFRVLDELALEAQCVVDGGEAEFDEVTLIRMLVYVLQTHRERGNSLHVHSGPA